MTNDKIQMTKQIRAKQIQNNFKCPSTNDKTTINNRFLKFEYWKFICHWRLDIGHVHNVPDKTNGLPGILPR